MASKEELLEFSQKFREELRKEAQAMMAADMPQTTEELFALFEQTGNRLKYEKVYFTRRKILAVLGLEAIARKLEGEQDAEKGNATLYEKLEAVIRDICQEECWALPAHVNRKEADWRITVDLFASETAQTIFRNLRQAGRSSFCGTRAACKRAGRREDLHSLLLSPGTLSKVGAR